MNKIVSFINIAVKCNACVYSIAHLIYGIGTKFNLNGQRSVNWGRIKEIDKRLTTKKK